MGILVVGGTHRGVGKTALVCGVIAALPEYKWIAAKITSHDYGRPDPVWEEMDAGNGTDTARYLAAGAARAFLVFAPDEAVGERLKELLRVIGPGCHLICESNRAVEVAHADLVLLLHDPDRGSAAKPSFERIAAKADALVVQSQHGDQGLGVGEAPGSAGRAQGEADSAVPQFQMERLERIPQRMREWLRSKIPFEPVGG